MYKLLLLMLDKINKLSLQNKFIIFVPYCDFFDEFIIECLQSIENQNYTNYDVVIVNDGGKKTDHIKIFISDKYNYTFINLDQHLREGHSKWKFTEYIQHNIDTYSSNDIVIIIDGDDYLYTNNALEIINDVYIETNCWITYGNHIGKYNSSTQYNKDISCLRKEPWVFSAPRTFKIEFIKHLKKEFFIYEDEYIKKASDVALMFPLIELCGVDKIKYIDTKIYFYRAHDNNSYKIIPYKYKIDAEKYIRNLPPLEQLKRYIHIVLCSNHKNNILINCLNSLSNQVNAQDIIIHLILTNNNFKISSPQFDNIQIILYNANISHHNYYQIYFIKHLLNKYLLDKIIIINDIKYYDNDWVIKMNNLYKLLHVTFSHNKSYSVNDLNSLAYFCLNTCIIDTNLFMHNEFDKFLYYNHDIIKNQNLFNKYLYRHINQIVTHLLKLELINFENIYIFNSETDVILFDKYIKNTKNITNKYIKIINENMYYMCKFSSNHANQKYIK